jgi:hypothetical protein
MSAVLTSTLPVTRPKIHRLPASHARKRTVKSPFSRIQMLWGAAFLILLTGGLVIFSHPVGIEKEVLDTASMVPQISVTPPEAVPQEKSLLSEASEMLSPPISDAQASTGVKGLPDSLEKIGNTVIFHGNTDFIVGQMAKIPFENEQITEIKPVQNIDNEAGRELLSIISKY